jgi:ATP-dependent Clp protease ATP-binding subunit ClpC
MTLSTHPVLTGTTNSNDHNTEELSTLTVQNNIGGGSKQNPNNNKPSSTKTLDEYSTDLTFKSKNGNLDPVIGRDAELERVVQILLRRTKNNPILLGEPGVGKTAIVEALAHLINSKHCPQHLVGKRVLSLNLSNLVAGTKYRGEFEERIKKIIIEAKSSKDLILFIDEIHTMIGAGAASGALDAANILKPELARGGIQIIGATTLDEYRKYFEKDAALERRFQPVIVAPPSIEDTILILKGLRSLYEKHHNVTITDDAIETAVRISEQYITDRFQPDKSIDLIDEACSRATLGRTSTTTEEISLSKEILHTKRQIKLASKSKDSIRQEALTENLKTLENSLNEIKVSKKEQPAPSEIIVDKNLILEVASIATGIPLQSMNQTDKQKLLTLEYQLCTNVIGHNEIMRSISGVFRRAGAGFKDPKRPIGSFLFLGPTGVGKTLTAQTIASIIFGNKDALIKIDMSEYMEKLSVSRLTGAPPGYVGFDEGGQLTEQVKRMPYSVVLFDEIEKAHPDALNLLLQVLEDGRLTDSAGRVIDFRNTVIIMTSNLGAIQIKDDKLGFLHSENNVTSRDSRINSIKRAASEYLRPEFLNRIDETCVFEHLGIEHMSEILDIELSYVHQRAGELGLELIIDAEAKNLLIKNGFDPEYGARPLRRAIQQYLLDPLAEQILSGKFNNSSQVFIRCHDSTLQFETSDEDFSSKTDDDLVSA